MQRNFFELSFNHYLHYFKLHERNIKSLFLFKCDFLELLSITNVNFSYQLKVKQPISSVPFILCTLKITLDVNINNLALTQLIQLYILLKQVNQMKNSTFLVFFILKIIICLDSYSNNILHLYSSFYNVSNVGIESKQRK